MSPTISRPQMLTNLKAALALVCFFALTVDALRASSTEGLMKKRRRMLHRKRDAPPLAKRGAVPVQTITVRPALLDSP